MRLTETETGTGDVGQSNGDLAKLIRCWRGQIQQVFYDIKACLRFLPVSNTVTYLW